MSAQSSNLAVPALHMHPPSPIEEEDGSRASTLKAPASSTSAAVLDASVPASVSTAAHAGDVSSRPETATSSGLYTESDSETGGYASSLLSMHHRAPPSTHVSRGPSVTPRASVAATATAPTATAPTATTAPIQPGRLSVFTRRAASRSAAEEPKRTMTIETETVANMSTLKAEHSSRSLRGRASTDTVRAGAGMHSGKPPKKKKSRLAVAGSMAATAAAASSGGGYDRLTTTSQAAQHVPTKSEIFAATLTQAVDENEDSDSEETFVYESNPRSPKRPSRSPSLRSLQQQQPLGQGHGHGHGAGPASLAPGLGGSSWTGTSVGAHSSSGGGGSQMQPASRVPGGGGGGGGGSSTGPGNLHDLGDRMHNLSRDLRHASRRGHAVSGKRSMKFANPYEEDRRVSYTLRGHQASHAGTHAASAGGVPHGSGQGHEGASPFRSPRLRPGLERKGSSPHSSGHASPRTGLSPPGSPFGTSAYKKTRAAKQLSAWSGYEDEEAALASERSPFLRRAAGERSGRRYEEDPLRPDGASTSRTGVPFVMAIVCLMLVVLLLGAAVLSTTQPLRNVKVLDLSHVLVSKQELLFDLVAQALNPNALAVQVSEVELSVFAQSPDVREQFFKGAGVPWLGLGGTGQESTTLLLGRVSFLESALQFESRFVNGSLSVTRGAVRIERPGDSTDDGAGHAVWERVIQHPFELIVRGVLRYRSSWLSHLVRTVEVAKTVKVDPARHIVDDADVLALQS